jgi:VCBS repeat-containing protein
MTDETGGPDPSFSYEFNFDQGMGPWVTWMPPSLITDEAGAVTDYVRLQAPGHLDPNHIDGIGALWLVSSLSIPVVGSPGILDLRDAEIEITIRGTDFDPNGAQLIFWVCTYVPESQTIRGFPVGVQVTNWAHTGGDLAGSVTDEWQTLTVRITDDPAEWTYAGNNVSSQGDWAYRYVELGLEQSISAVDATLHLVMVSDTPLEQPSGFLDIAGITIKTQQPAVPQVLQPDYIGHGVEDQTIAGTLTASGAVGTPIFNLVAGSAQQGLVTLDPVTGAFVFTANANFYGPGTDRPAAKFQYTVTDDNGTSAAREAFFYIAPINDAPTVALNPENHLIAFNKAFEFSLFHGDDVDGDQLTFAIVAGSVQHGTVVVDPTTGRYTFTPDAGFSGQAGFQYLVSDGHTQSAPKQVTLEVAHAGEVVPIPTLDQIGQSLSAGDLDAFARGIILLAQTGEPNAAYHYANFLLAGRFVAMNLPLAAQYLEQAIDTVPDAKLLLAALYTAGDGVPRDYAMARTLLGSVTYLPEAEYRLGLLDHLGLGGPQNDLTADERFLAAAKLGHGDAMYTLGRRYLDGEGVQASDTDAYFWIGLAVRFNARADMPLFQDVLRSNQAEAGASLTPAQRSELDAAIATWQVGSPTPVNDAPVTASGPEQVAGDGETIISGTLLRGFDVDADRLTYWLESGSATNGSVVIDHATGAFAFTPAVGFSGDAQFEYRVSDGWVSSEAKIVTVHVARVTAALADDAAVEENGTVGAGAGSGVLANDIAVDGGVLAVNAVGGSGALVGVPVAGLYGTLTLNADGSYSYVADRALLLTEGQLGVDIFTYGIRAANGSSASSTLTFTVLGRAGVVLGGNGTLIGTSYADALTGGPGADYLVGLGGDDRLDGGLGLPNALQGGTGNDRYIVRNVGDSVTEFVNEGLDTVETPLAAYTIAANIENLIYTGTGNFTGIGNELANTIIGKTNSDYLIGLGGDDVLDGGLGAADSLQGGTGNDRYIVRNGDTVTEFAGEGLDTVETPLAAYTLPGNVENLIFTGTGNFAGTGNELANTIAGGAGNDLLEGRGGNNVLSGGAGSDTAVYTAATSGISANLGAGRTNDNGFGGSDTLNAIENLIGSDFRDILVGGAEANRLEGGLGADYLIGMGGDDVLVGGAGLPNQLQGGIGNDTYVLSAGGDTVVEFADEGLDTIETSIAAYTLAANFEILIYTGSGDFTGLGNDLANTITGGLGRDYLIGLRGDDVLDGGLGVPDSLQGGIGNDRYIVRDGDTVTEFANEGLDTVETTLATYALSPNVENLIFFGTGNFAGTGNELANTITGGAGDDRLEGRGGNNVLSGGAGTDTAVYAAAASGISANLGAGRTSDNGFGGSDTLNGIENLTGSDFRDVMVGSAAANRLEGGLGNDYLIGMDGDDVLVGGTGLANQLQGGLGNDTFILSVDGDTIVEFANEGQDTVETSLATYTLSANVENLIYIGGGSFIGTGNELANLISGGGASDRLIGGGGADLFQFRTPLGGGNVDSLPDFVSGQDRIALDHAVFANLPGGSLANAFVLGTGAQDADDRIVYDQATGALWYDADGNGAGQAIQFASLAAGTPLTASDFLVV